MSPRYHIDAPWFLRTQTALCVLASLALVVWYWAGCGLCPTEPVAGVR